MIAPRQKAYLDAMGIPVWVLRGAQTNTSTACSVQLGPGPGQVLLLCSAPQDSAGKLASDIARALCAEPVWGWPVDDESGVPLEDSVRERLFTHVVVFGSEAEAAGFGGPAPTVMGSAAVIRVPALSELRHSVAARRTLWSTLCQHRLAGPRSQAGQR